MIVVANAVEVAVAMAAEGEMVAIVVDRAAGHTATDHKVTGHRAKTKLVVSAHKVASAIAMITQGHPKRLEVKTLMERQQRKAHLAINAEAEVVVIEDEAVEMAGKTAVKTPAVERHLIHQQAQNKQRPGDFESSGRFAINPSAQLPINHGRRKET